ncbi:SDR family NAD(P)-dependent oxidoreductase [Pseudoruegeria sp. SHC-113]|uniref:SDR family NAD(P)-dependent oxidoreductase n=1 Tax=Pseudoruegeria sp. SHC-113 TaxID=2855439 RepID=UPI0021BA7B19|nr:SDR family oxidoreductase [Pseudoruegeria sp. SHC-113]MCT8160042.1 SDR family oxidoreductase [Pseudoruegeria sp. SHC-113]
MTVNTEKTALVTGASRGLGNAVAYELAAKGYHVIAVGRTTGALEELDDRIQAAGGSATLAPMDVTVDEAMMHLCRSIHDRWGGLDVWAHAAIHAAPLSPAGHVALKDWEKSLAVNTRAVGRLIGFVEPLLLARQGEAIFFDDDRAGQKFFGAYGASKAAGMALAQSWQAETEKTGPKVHILAPAPMATATRARFFPGENRDVLASPAEEASRLLAGIELG